jgi:Na+:H+ antiporter
VKFFSSNSLWSLLLTAGVAIVAVLLARLAMVLMLRTISHLMRGAILPSWRFVIFWSGLRGALSLALVLALPFEVPARNALIFSTYAVVLFTLLVQGFSLRLIIRRLPSTMPQE